MLFEPIRSIFYLFYYRIRCVIKSKTVSLLSWNRRWLSDSHVWLFFFLFFATFDIQFCSLSTWGRTKLPRATFILKLTNIRLNQFWRGPVLPLEKTRNFESKFLYQTLRVTEKRFPETTGFWMNLSSILLYVHI